MEDARRFLATYRSTHPCVDCDEHDPVVLEFDHVGPKRHHISALSGQATSVRALRREIASCEVVCANCHRRRTARRARWRKADPNWRIAPASLLPAEKRNVDFAYAVLEDSGCTDCGISELCVLEFDHVSDKTANVLTFARSGCSLQRLKREIARCAVRCANCHRRRTARVGAYYRYTATL